MPLGVEFHELDLGGPTERPFCTDTFNARGWHGNAILSKTAFQRVTMVRLCDHGHWFASTESDTDPDQPRVGRRMALLAVVPGENSPICLVSTHLESNADAPYRDVQFDMLMDAIDAFAPKMPVLIGGDLNTGNHLPPDFDWRRETLFARADARGFSGQTRALIPALAPSAKPLSDHDAVCCRVHSGRVTKVSHS